MLLPHAPRTTNLICDCMSYLSIHKSAKDGFAAVIALSLMAFILVLLLGLTALVRVESVQAGNQLLRLEAEQNAYLGLQIAVGRLQAAAGRDQVATASGDLLDGSGYSGTSAHPSKRHWTGVWDTSDWSDFDPNNRSFSNWLVSVSDSSGLALDEAALRSLAFAESPYVVGDRSIPLVDTGTLGPLYEEEDRVLVDKIQIEDSGAYAFWVSDESRKARLNIDLPTTFETELSVEDEHNFWMSAPQPNLNRISGLDPTVLRRNDETIEKAATFRQSWLIPDADPGEEQLRKHFHTLTTVSSGLLTDASNGGLRKDLNTAFELDDSEFNVLPGFSEPLPDELGDQRYVLSDPLDTSSQPTKLLYFFSADLGGKTRAVRGPSFHLLRDFYKSYERIDNNGRIAATPPAPDPSDFSKSIPFDYLDIRPDFQGGIREDRWGDTDINEDALNPLATKKAPVVSRIMLTYSLQSVPLATPYEKEISGGETKTYDRRLSLLFNPIITLWNPYSVPIEFTGVILVSGPTGGGYPFPDAFKIFHGDFPDKDDPPARRPDSYMAQQRDHLNIYVGSKDGNPIVLQPGESRVFTDRPDEDARYFGGKTRGGGIRDMHAVEGFTASSFEGGVRSITLDRIGDADWDNYYGMNGRIDGDANSEVRIQWRPVDSWYGGNKAKQGWYGGTRRSFTFSVLLTDEPFGTDDLRNVQEGLRGNANLQARYKPIGYIHTGREYYWYLDTAYVKPTFPGEKFIEFPDGGAGSGVPMGNLDQPRIFATLDIRLKTADELDNPRPLLGAQSPIAMLQDPRVSDYIVTGRTAPGYRVEFRGESDPNPIDIDYGTGRTFFGPSMSDIGDNFYFVANELPTSPIYSMGAMQHADVSFFGHQPLYAIGNSFASTFVPRNQVISHLADASSYAGTNSSDGKTQADISYLANRALWDEYFFSSIFETSTKSFPDLIDDLEDGDTTPFANERIAVDETFPLDGEDFEGALTDAGGNLSPEAHAKVAHFLRIVGPFNVNSTSVDAWKSMLSSLDGMNVRYGDQGGSSIQNQANPFSRFSIPKFSNVQAASGPDYEKDWSGFLNLSDNQIDDLATAIVAEVKRRGPFQSLAHFVNRQLTSDDTGRLGALQAAVEKTDINNRLTSGAYSGVVEPNDVSLDPEGGNIVGTTSTGAATYLLQADILKPIAPTLTTRGDTFLIRTYGSARDPLNGDTVSEVYLEAVVQRIPDYVNNNADLSTDLPNADGDAEENENFGRKFKIVASYWIPKEDV